MHILKDADVTSEFDIGSSTTFSDSGSSVEAPQQGEDPSSPACGMQKKIGHTRAELGPQKTDGRAA